MSWYPTKEEAKQNLEKIWQQATGNSEAVQQEIYIFELRNKMFHSKLRAKQKLSQISSLVRAKRTTLGLSQELLAEYCGIALEQIINLENGVNIEISAEQLLVLFDALGLDFNLL